MKPPPGPGSGLKYPLKLLENSRCIKYVVIETCICIKHVVIKNPVRVVMGVIIEIFIKHRHAYINTYAHALQAQRPRGTLSYGYATEGPKDHTKL